MAGYSACSVAVSLLSLLMAGGLKILQKTTSTDSLLFPLRSLCFDRFSDPPVIVVQTEKRSDVCSVRNSQLKIFTREGILQLCFLHDDSQ